MQFVTNSYHSISEKSEQITEYIEDSKKLAVAQATLEILQELSSETDYAETIEFLASVLSEDGALRQSLGVLSGSSKQELMESFGKDRVKDQIQSTDSFSSYARVLHSLTQVVYKSPKVQKIFEEFFEVSERCSNVGSTIRSLEKIRKLEPTDSNRKVITTYLSTMAKILPLAASALDTSSTPVTLCLTLAAIAEPLLTLTNVYSPEAKSHGEKVKDLKKAVIKEISAHYEATLDHIDSFFEDFPDDIREQMEVQRKEMRWHLSIDKDHFNMSEANDAKSLLSALEDYKKYGFTALNFHGLSVAKSDSSENLEKLIEEVKELQKG